MLLFTIERTSYQSEGFVRYGIKPRSNSGSRNHKRGTTIYHEIRLFVFDHYVLLLSSAEELMLVPFVIEGVVVPTG